ncbi:membrane protein insertase YidC [Clostridium subterminale]|uniref:Membrane protein insertase YidC n=1 Tax=Clostridium subterminale TaxID=1550 RepID=A0ABP3VW23_CLOSU
MNYLSGIFEQVFYSVHNFVQLITTNPDISFGVAIIIFTFLARICLLPLSLKQTKSTAKMSAIQPEIKKVQEKYKNDPQRQQTEIMKVYKENNVSMFGGCLPMLIQFPIMIALFYVFKAIDYQGAGFLWVPDLAQKDPTMILPIVSGLTTYFSSKAMQPATGDAAKQTNMMNIGMSIFFGFMSLQFPGALVLYWTVGNLIQMAQSLILNKIYKKPNTKSA